VIIIQKHRCVGPLLPVKCGNMELEYTNKTKLLGVTVDNRLICGESTWIRCISHSVVRKIRVLKKMSYLPPKLPEEIYFKTIIPQLTNCIAVWGNCAVAMFTEIERLHI